MAASTAQYKKKFTILENERNTVWLSRFPDKSRHVLTIRPRYVDERLGKVEVKGGDVNGNIVTEFDKADVEIGFEVQNQHTSWVVVEMHHGDKVVACFALTSGQTYFFDNRNALDKKRFSLVKKTRGPGGSAVIASEAKADEQNIYKFVVKHIKGDDWPARLQPHLDAEIKVPCDEKLTPPPPPAAPMPRRDYGGFIGFSEPHRSLCRAAEFDLLTGSASGSLSLPVAAPASLPGFGGVAEAQCAMAMSPPPKTEAFATEQRLGSTNTERLKNLDLDVDHGDSVFISFMAVLRE